MSPGNDTTAPDESDKAYVFDLHLLCGGYAYFSTITLWSGDDNGRDIRKPSLTIVSSMEVALNAIGQWAFLIRDRSDYEHWLFRRGWGVVPKPLAFELMPQWLKPRVCLRDAIGTFTDMELAAPGVVKHHAVPGKRKQVMEREGHRCLLCGATEEDGTELTMQHVTPFSQGGETTTRNLVLLCKKCNQALGTTLMHNLYDLVGLPHWYDLALVKGEVTQESKVWAMKISKNLMHTRCEVW